MQKVRGERGTRKHRWTNDQRESVAREALRIEAAGEQTHSDCELTLLAQRVLPKNQQRKIVAHTTAHVIRREMQRVKLLPPSTSSAKRTTKTSTPNDEVDDVVRDVADLLRSRLRSSNPKPRPTK